MSPLKNNQQEKFCLAIMEGKNQTEAAIDAGYKFSRAAQTSSRLVRNGKISARLDELKQAVADAKIMTVRERKERLSEIGRARVSDFTEVTEDGARIKIDLKSANAAAINEVTTETVSIGGKDSDMLGRITKLKLRDPVGAIAELNKMEKIYSDAEDKGSVKINSTVNVIQFDLAAVARAIVEAERLGISAESIGGNGHHEANNLLPAPTDIQATPVPKSQN